jgi:hypothetical protein
LVSGGRVGYTEGLENPMRGRRFGAVLFLLVASAAALLACGRKGDPYPRRDLHRPGQEKPASEGGKGG